MAYLEMSSVTKTYRGATAPCFEDLDLSVEEGEILAILGSSGCGKTTILKVIAGLEEQDSGTVCIGGEYVDGLPPERRSVAMVFQKPLLFRNMTVEQNVNYAPRVRRLLPSDQLAEETDRMLSLVRLEGYNDRRPRELSGGQEQRVSLARALITHPKVLLLDEPFSALDAELRVEMREEVRALCKSLGLTVLFVTHDQQEAVAMGDRIALMSDGRIVQIGTSEDFYRRPATAEVARFFGWRNLVPARASGGIVSSPIGDYRKDVPDGDVLLAVRPEAMTDDCDLRGTVISVSYRGAFSDVSVDCGGTRLSFTVLSARMPQAGSVLRFGIDPEQVWAVPVPPKKAVRETPSDVRERNGLLKRLGL